MTSIDPLERVLARAREGLSPSDAQVQRMWGGLSVNTTAGSEAAVAAAARPAAGHVAVAAAAAGGRWAALRATGASGWFAASLLVSGGFVAGYFAHSAVASRDVAPPANVEAVVALADTLPSAPPAPLPAPAASSAAPALPNIESPVAAALPEVAATPSLAESQRKPRPLPRSTRASASPQLPAEPAGSQELVLLERVERALRNGDAPLARALLSELEERHPNTRLGEERQAARLMADCVANAPGADRAAEQFVQTHPSSVYASRLRALCWIP